VATDKPLGYVKIVDSGISRCTAQPFSYRKVPAVANLPDRGLCEPVRLVLESESLRVTFDKAPGFAVEGQEKLRDALEARSRDPGALFRIVDDLSNANWVIQAREGRPLVVPRQAAEVLARGVSKELPREQPSFPFSIDTAGEQLPKMLNKIARAEALLAIAADDDAMANSVAAERLDVAGDDPSAIQRGPGG
jgi:hypothetical protein